VHFQLIREVVIFVVRCIEIV